VKEKGEYIYIYKIELHCDGSSEIVSLFSLLGNGSSNKYPRQRIHALIEEMLDPFSMRPVSLGD
jgi:hypothetical protein